MGKILYRSEKYNLTRKFRYPPPSTDMTYFMLIIRQILVGTLSYIYKIDPIPNPTSILRVDTYHIYTSIFPFVSSSAWITHACRFSLHTFVLIPYREHPYPCQRLPSTSMSRSPASPGPCRAFASRKQGFPSPLEGIRHHHT